MFRVFCSKYLLWVIDFHKNQLIVTLHNKTLYNNVNFISLGKIFNTQDTFGRNLDDIVRET